MIEQRLLFSMGEMRDLFGMRGTWDAVVDTLLALLCSALLSYFEGGREGLSGGDGFANMVGENSG